MDMSTPLAKDLGPSHTPQWPFQVRKLEVPITYEADLWYHVRAKFQGICPNSMALHGTGPPALWQKTLGEASQQRFFNGKRMPDIHHIPSLLDAWETLFVAPWPAPHCS